MIERDHSGSISSREMKQVFRALEIQASDTEIQQIIKQMDTDGNNEISFEEDTRINVIPKQNQSQQEEFDDDDNENYLDAETVEVEEILKLEQKEIELIKKSLERHKGKRKAAADELGISERTLYRKIKQFDL